MVSAIAGRTLPGVHGPKPAAAVTAGTPPAPQAVLAPRSAPLAMVFVIQHTRARRQAATQRKLDEILQAMPGDRPGQRRARVAGSPPGTGGTASSGRSPARTAGSGALCTTPSRWVALVSAT